MIRLVQIENTIVMDITGKWTERPIGLCLKHNRILVNVDYHFKVDTLFCRCVKFYEGDEEEEEVEALNLVFGKHTDKRYTDNFTGSCQIEVKFPIWKATLKRTLVDQIVVQDWYYPVVTV